MPDDPSFESKYELEWGKKGIAFKRTRTEKGLFEKAVDTILSRALRKHLPFFGTLLGVVGFGVYVVIKQPRLGDYLPTTVILGSGFIFSCWLSFRK